MLFSVVVRNGKKPKEFRAFPWRESFLFAVPVCVSTAKISLISHVAKFFVENRPAACGDSRQRPSACGAQDAVSCGTVSVVVVLVRMLLLYIGVMWRSSGGLNPPLQRAVFAPTVISCCIFALRGPSRLYTRTQSAVPACIPPFVGAGSARPETAGHHLRTAVGHLSVTVPMIDGN